MIFLTLLHWWVLCLKSSGMKLTLVSLRKKKSISTEGSLTVKKGCLSSDFWMTRYRESVCEQDKGGENARVCENASFVCGTCDLTPVAKLVLISFPFAQEARRKSERGVRGVEARKS